MLDHLQALQLNPKNHLIVLKAQEKSKNITELLVRESRVCEEDDIILEIGAKRGTWLISRTQVSQINWQRLETMTCLLFVSLLYWVASCGTCLDLSQPEES